MTVKSSLILKYIQIPYILNKMRHTHLPPCAFQKRHLHFYASHKGKITSLIFYLK